MMGNLSQYRQFDNAYANRKVFLTGHTGFKGTWLSTWLQCLGAEVTGYALAPNTLPNHFSMLEKPRRHFEADIQDGNRLMEAVQSTRPEIVFHLAAQPLVRDSYRQPITTFDVNVLGTARLLEAARHTPSVKAVVIVTTDKCYENKEWCWGYRENDPLGGYDPYSASKACAEIVTACYRRSFPSETLIASGRAGNVIGGGDWSRDRLIPDLVRAVENKETTRIRMPSATRPWQHVLEPLSGYLRVGQKLLEGDKTAADAWNFGPGGEGNLSVGNLVDKAMRHWNALRVEIAPDTSLHEAALLMLDCSKAATYLNWTPVWDIDRTVEKTITWYKAYYEEGNVLSEKQLSEYVSEAAEQGKCWCTTA